MLRKLILAVVGALLLVLATHLAISAWSGSRLERWETVWGEELFGGRSPSEVYPPREANRTARLAEATAEELGIRFRPQSDAAPEEGSAMPPADGREVSVSPYLLGVVESEGHPAPAPEEAIVSRVEAEGERLDELAAELAAETPRWAFELDRALETPVLDYPGHKRLHSLLLAAALVADGAGEHGRAGALLEGAWALREGIREDPLIIAQLIAASELNRELAVLRHVCPPRREAWIERLGRFDLPADYRQAMRLEARASSGLLEGDTYFTDLPRPMRPFGRAVGRLFTVGMIDATEEAVAELRRTPWSTFDVAQFDAARREKIPAWNPLAAMTLPNLYDGWHKAGRAQISVEFTERVLRAGAGRLELGEEPSGLDDSLVWRTSETPTGEIEIALFHADGTRADALTERPDGRRPATRFLVEPERCASSDGDAAVVGSIAP